MKAKVAIGGVLFVAFALWIVSVVTVMGGLADITNGIYSSGCATANFLQDLLVGGEGFIGLIPVEEQFIALEGHLTDGSTFFQKLESKMDETRQIDGAVALASATVAELKTTLEAVNAMAVQKKHTCQLCDQLVPQLDSLVDLLDNGVGAALVDARSQVSAQLQGPQMEELAQTFRDGVTPIRDTKNAMTASIGWFVTPGGLDKYTPFFQGQASPLGLMIIYACLCLSLFLLCGICSLGCWHFKEKKEVCEPGENPHRKLSPMCSRCTWCNSMILAMNLCLLGGIIMIVSVPISGLCLYLFDMDGPLIQTSSDIIGIDLGTSSDMVIAVVDRCLSIKAAETYAGQSSNLMDIYQVESADGTMQSMREQVVTTAIDPVNEAFGEITSSLDSAGSAELSQESALIALRDALATIAVSSSMFPDFDVLQSDPDYMALGGNADLAAESAQTSLNCDTVIVSLDGTDTTSKGITSYVSYVSAMDSGISSSAGTSCANKDSAVSCDGSLLPPMSQYCDAAANLVDLKMEALQVTTLSCNLFRDASGNSCDPRNMVLNTMTNTWSNICLGSNGEVSRDVQNCDLSGIDDYVNYYNERLEKVIQYLDWQVVTQLDAVNVGLRAVVDDNIVNPIYSIVDQFECAFMRDFWTGLLDGFCYRGANGFAKLGTSYVISAFTAFVTAIAGYATFRLAQDNMDVWAEREAEPETQSETI